MPLAVKIVQPDRVIARQLKRVVAAVVATLELLAQAVRPQDVSGFFRRKL